MNIALKVPVDKNFIRSELRLKIFKLTSFCTVQKNKRHISSTLRSCEVSNTSIFNWFSEFVPITLLCMLQKGGREFRVQS